MATSTKLREPEVAPPRHFGDRVFSGAAFAAGVTILVILAGVALFLLYEGVPGMTADQADYAPKSNFLSYVGPLAFGTILASVIALITAVPVAIGIALFISHYAPRPLAAALGYLIDLLAAVPSVVIGLWGFETLGSSLLPLTGWLADNLGWIPLFAGPASVTGRTMLTAGLVLGVMILPIVTAICREVFLQTPRLHEEAALALGATRWEMIRMAVFPYARSGIVSGAMLGLGRALGETLAVTIVLAPSILYTFNIIGSTNSSTIASNIALQFPEASGARVNVLIATGLVLFVLTFAVNYSARKVVERRREFSGAN